MKVISLLLLSSLCISGYSQDYLVTHKGDTVRGELKPLSYDQLDRVQITENKKKTIYTALQVKGIYFKNDWYRPIRKDNAIRFMKLLKPGFLGLYAFKMENQVTYDGRILIKQDGSTMEVPNLNFKKAMINFLADCPTLKDKLTAGEYGRRDLNTIIDQFNDCMESQAQELKKSIAQVSEANKKGAPLEELRKTIEGLSDFSGRKDALDLIDDMIAKIIDAKPIPNYQVEALKGYLSGNEATKADLDNFLATLKNN